jgi:hypothetical protein
MASKPARYERLIPDLSAQSKRNIGEGRVLKNIIRRGELPQGTTLAEAREFDIDLTKRPRKGKRKKGLLPEMTKKEYKDQLGKKIKDFSKEEKRIYNAMAQRERRGYVVDRSADQSLADELDDFLAEDEPAPIPIEEPPLEPLGDLDDILASLPTGDELPAPLEAGAFDIVPVAEEIKIPKGVSAKVSMELVDVETESEEDDVYDDIVFESVLGVEPPPKKKVNRRPSRANPLLLSNSELREYTSDPSLSREERSQRAREVQLGYVRLDKVKAKAEREAQKIRQRENRIREREEQRQQAISDREEERRLEEQRRLAEKRVEDARRVEESMREIRAFNRQMDEEIRDSLLRKPVRNTRKTREELQAEVEDIKDDDELANELDDFLADEETANELEDFLEEDTTESEEEDLPPLRPFRGKGGKVPRVPIAPSTPSPTFQPDPADNFYQFGSPQFQEPEPTTPRPDTRLLFQSPKSRKKRTPPTRQQRVGVPSNTKQSLREAGVGNLSLGGATQSYRLRDFEMFPQNPDQTPSTLNLLIKNNRNRKRNK